MIVLILVRNSSLNNNDLAFKNLKFVLGFHFILDGLVFRALSSIAMGDSLLGGRPSYRQPPRKETLSAIWLSRQRVYTMIVNNNRASFHLW